MPMIPKPMTDINSESAYEKLKFIPEHYNEIMAAYTDIMEHLKLPVMNDTGGGGSGEDCLHEVVEVVNPCPAYVQFDLNINIEYDGIYYTYKDNWGDYNTSYMYWLETDNTLKTAIKDALIKYNREYPNNSIYLIADSSKVDLFPKTNLAYTIILLDKTTGEPVENMDKDYEFDGYDKITYDIVSEMYDIKLALIDLDYYSCKPTILGDFYEKLVEIRNSKEGISSYLSKLPTPEEFGRLLNVSLTDHDNNKVAIKLLTEEERVEVRKYIEMNTSDNVPPDTPYMYALDLFCHPSTVDDVISVKCNINGSYSKGYIDKYDSLDFGRDSMGCGDPEDVTYIYSSLPLTPIHFSNSYTYFKDTSYSDKSKGTVVMPQTFKLIQSKEGIDRRL
jgi:hypothetical protein